MLGFREKVDLERSEIVEAEVKSLQVGEVAQAWDLIIQNSENGAVIGFQGEREREREKWYIGECFATELERCDRVRVAGFAFLQDLLRAQLSHGLSVWCLGSRRGRRMQEP